MRILLAEDNPVNQKVAMRMLERIGFSADVATNGIEALKALESKTYDVILMDMQMPEMDGLEATRKIVELYTGPERPYIIALTANAMQGDRERCLDAGMNDYISKPIRMEDLHQAFERCPRKATSEDPSEADDSPGEAAIDFSVLEELVAMLGNDMEFASGLIKDFLEDGEELLGSIKTAQETGDNTELERAAHTLKSSSATFGAIEASRLCKDIEEHGNQGRITDETAKKIGELDSMFSKVSKALEHYVSRQVG